MNRHLSTGHMGKIDASRWLIRAGTVLGGACVAAIGAGAALCRAHEPATRPASINPSSEAATVPVSGPVAPEASALQKLSLTELMNLEVATVTTASKEPEKVTDAPATAIVVTAQDIRNRGYSNIVDVLRDLPGMETLENYYTEIGTLVPVRGISGGITNTASDRASTLKRPCAGK